ncbi:GlxA family transcriptional regulator [Duganella sp. Dugasp56]|uniref:GlxA family transcriptional regulator n=1 Tax=Duganella sp. Dugasp56 TaxID=3243046 RepID=UPI0039B0E687
MKKRIVILGLPPVDALDVIGPAEVFTYANRQFEPQAAPYSLELVGASPDATLDSDTGIGLRAHRTLEQERRSSKPIDTLLVATGFNAVDRFERPTIEWIRSHSKKIRRVCSICVGAFALAEAGLLDGRKATTHWSMAQQLADRFPDVQVDPSPIWVKDDHVYTSAGVSAGIDLALKLVGDDLGDDIALEVAKKMVLFLRRPGGQAQFSTTLLSQHAPHSSLNDLCVWICDHLYMELTVDMLADRVSTSSRTLIRMFRRDLQTTPAKYVEDVRLEAVCRALELGTNSMEEIMRQCGYQSLDVLRKAFARRFGVSPRDYARGFAP